MLKRYPKRSPKSTPTPGSAAFKRRSASRVLVWAFAIFGVAALGYWAALTWGAKIYQTNQKRAFAAAVSAPHLRQLPTHTSPPKPGIGARVALLTIPRLEMSLVVVEGAGERELRLGPGHIPGTALLGRPGNIGIAGHRDSFFRPLRLIRQGDRIELTTAERTFHYSVESTRIVSPSDVSVLRSSGSETLTLVTCYPFYFAGAAPHRFIVRAPCEDCAAR
jgi:LPXTG-site transpeptidase (sortase) family protein